MSEEPRGWDLNWWPVDRAGAPSRLPPTDDAVYAEAPVRAFAFVIDAVLALLLGQLASQVLALLVAGWSRTAPITQETAVLAASLAHVVTCVLITLIVVYSWRTFRQSPGQMALRLYVLRRGSGQRLALRRAFVRWLVLYLPLAFVMSYQTFSSALSRIPATAQVDSFLTAGAALLLPVAWWLVLGLSVLAERRRGRGLHDRLAGSVVVRKVSG